MFQILHLPHMQKRLRLMVDSASPITFINIMTWKDLEKPQLQSTDRVLGAFEGQPIKPLGYFLTPVLQARGQQQSKMVSKISRSPRSQDFYGISRSHMDFKISMRFHRISLGFCKIS